MGEGHVVTACALMGPRSSAVGAGTRATAVTSAWCVIPYLFPPRLCRNNILSLIYYKYFNADNNNEKYLA